MQEIQYIGEHLLPGRIGHLFVIIAFVSAILSVLAYRKSTLQSTDESWRRLSRIAFTVHGVSILSIIGLLFYMMIGQFYEYRYVWDHVSDDLPMKYIFSAFWEGQEGSFLLWMFWHVVLGFVVIRTAKRWEPGVMTWLSLIQVVLVSMIMGIYFTDDFKFGSSPFLLLRETMDAPIFMRPDYLSMIEGNGLNPLLQNYWMTIHPPTLFLGFASVAIPFCFAMAAIWEKDHTAWMKPAMPWTLFSAGILGTGILMGGAWAYEALSFEGYWAWDPVENMSLVPWLILLAAMHGNFIARHTNHSIKTTYLFYMLAFVLVLYSTFLTRSGILGKESVHAFTEMGLEWQLIGFMGIFALSGAYFLLTRNKSIPTVKTEESIRSREFWMFIGALILVFSSILITFTTSIPVWNKLIDVYGSIMNKGDMTPYHKAMPLDVVDHHNRFQLWIGVLLAIISCIGQALRFHAMGWDLHRQKFLRHIVASAVIGGIVAFLFSLWIELPSWQYIVLLIAASFGIVANTDYIISFIRGRWMSMGSALSHGGFALMIIGIMVSGLNKQSISQNRFAQAGLAEGVDEGESVLLIKEMPMFMNGFWVTYKSDTLEGFTRMFEVEFKRLDEKGDTVETFTTYPNVLYDRKLSKVAAQNPDTKHYLNKDIFTYVDGLPAEQQDIANIQRTDSALTYKPYLIRPGQTIETESFIVRLDTIALGTQHEGYIAEPNDLVLSGTLTVHAKDSAKYGSSVQTINPTLIIRKGLLYGLSDQINAFGLRMRIGTPSVDSLLPIDDKLQYDAVIIKPNTTTTWRDLKITMNGVDKNIDHPNYIAEPGDIAIQGMFTIQSPDGRTHITRPLYFIRDGRALNMKAYVPDLALHMRLENINPETEEFTLLVARSMEAPALIIEAAEEAPRNDFIVLKAVLFPGINLFWAGSIIMLGGMFLGMFKRLRKSK
jgi:cytochrome c-type biogenesis protein CcmF